MPITPLPQFEADLSEFLAEQSDRDAYERLRPPETVVVKFGRLGLVGEYPYTSSAKPGCGSKLVVRTHRGTEIGEMLTSTCANSGCGKSVTRQQMLDYIDRSGGADYPFYENGRALRVASVHDIEKQDRLDAKSDHLRRDAQRLARELNLDMKIIDAEPILGEERLTFYFISEQRVDFRDLLSQLRDRHNTRIELHHVGSRDEARITADYERCGQYCCCKSFLKVLKPVSMKSAKVQKATLDPLKISGRCGRLMCCLRYEDETYEELRKKLPHRRSKVGTPEGDGIVVRTQILTQLVLVSLDTDRREVAVPVEDLTEPGLTPPKPEPKPQPRRADRDAQPGEGKRRRRRRGKQTAQDGTDTQPSPAQRIETAPGEALTTDDQQAPPAKRKRRRRRRGKSADQGGAPPPATAQPGDASTPSPSPADPSGEGNAQPTKKRRRRRRKRKPDAGGGSA